MAKNAARTDKTFITAGPLQLRLRALVASLNLCDEAGDSAEQILLDTELDGERYLLVRMKLFDRKATPLSPREIEIVRLVADGHPNKVIAAVLDISSWTVCTHLRRIFAKLNVTSRAAMVSRLSEFGWSKEASAPALVKLRQSHAPYPAPPQKVANFKPEPSKEKLISKVRSITPMVASRA